MLSHPEIFLLAAGVFLGFFAQTIVGFAAALISFPFLLQVYNLQEATAFLAFYYVIFSLVLIYKNYKDIDKQVFKDIAVPAVFGYIIGFYILKVANPVFLEKVLGVFVITYCVYEWYSKKTFVIPKPVYNFLGFLGGIFGGIFSSGAAFFGPLVTSRVKNGYAIRATLLAVFAIANFSRFPFVIFTGILSKQMFLKSLIIFPVFALALWLGHVAFKYINEQLLRKLILLFLIVSGIMFLVK